MPKKLLVNSQTQLATLFEDDRILKTYVVSTALNGLGCTENSDCTPTGKLKVAQKIGEGLPLGAILKARKATGEVWSSAEAPRNEDLVLTRLLWLEGAEETNLNTFKRFIYLHGTNQEHLLGQAVSHGCIRFSNQDILEVYDLLDLNSEVEVL
jgi:L,D-transpeptidase YbiS